MSRKILFIGGSMNQTTQMHQIARHLPEYQHYFSPFYTDTALRHLVDWGMLDFTIMAGPMRRQTEEYLQDNRLEVDYGGRRHCYDLVLLSTDLLVPSNISASRVVLVQEGMTDPENFMYKLVCKLKLPRLLASTASTGLSDSYDRFCVASDGYREHFLNKGVAAEKLRVTGIPNFDNAATYLDNDFPERDYVLVATSDTRECLKFDSRTKFLRQCQDLVAGRRVIFKLHPNENVERSTREIHEFFPGAPVYSRGNTNHMIANCRELITQYSSVVYVGIALGKPVHSYFDLDELHSLAPIQNGGTSGRNIAEVCRELLEDHGRVAEEAAGLDSRAVG